MMKPYLVVTEGTTDVLLLQAILGIQPHNSQVAFEAVGGWSRADSYSRTILIQDIANVAIVVGADTINIEEAEGRKRFLHRSLGDVTMHKKYCVVVIAPEIEALLFRQRSIVEKLVGKPVLETELIEARYEPKKILGKLLYPDNLLKAYNDKLPEMDLSPLANEPELRDLKKFLSRSRHKASVLS